MEDLNLYEIDGVGAVSQSELDLARELINQGVVGDVDIVGDLDIVGDDLDIVGARRRAGPARRTINAASLQRLAAQAKQGQQLAQRVAQGRPAAVNQPRDKDVFTRYLVFARDTENVGLIAAGGAADVTSQPQSEFRPTALIVDDESARDFLLVDIKIGTESLNIGGGGGPMSMTDFKGDSVLNEMLTRTGRTSQMITLRVRNRAASDRPFYAKLKGWGTV